MANYPQELVQDAVCQSHNGHMTGLWFMPAQPLRLNTNELMKLIYITQMLIRCYLQLLTLQKLLISPVLLRIL